MAINLMAPKGDKKTVALAEKVLADLKKKNNKESKSKQVMSSACCGDEDIVCLHLHSLT